MQQSGYLPSGRVPNADPHPLHRQPRSLLLVLLGGMAGTLARWGVGRVVPPGGWHWPTLLANLTGALLLGLLLDALLRLGPDEGGRRAARLLLGTGFLGAYTTWSTLATETVLLLDAGRTAHALAYLGLSVLGGIVMAWLGILAAGRVRARAGAGEDR